MQVGMKESVTIGLMIDEARFSRTHAAGAKFLYINPTKWDKFCEETPYAPYYSKGRMTYYNAKVFLDSSIEKWEFSDASR